MKTLIRHLSTALALCLGLSGLAAAKPGAAAGPATAALEVCSWNRPGVNPFMGDVVAAVDRYRDIDPAVRERLKARMARREYDDLVSIRRDRIDGRGGYDYGSAITDMHFGTDQLCRSVDRAAWTPTMEERGLVYCDSGHCILVPTVCRNVSRITRRGVGDEVAAGPPLLLLPPPAVGDDAAAALPPAFAELPGDLIDGFGPTGAGLPPAAAGPLDAGADAAGTPGSFSGYGIGGGSAAGATGGGGVAAAGGRPGVFGTGSGGAPDTSTSSTPPSVVEGGGGTAAIAPVPEPGTWASIVAGLAVLIGAARRRRAVSRRAAA